MENGGFSFSRHALSPNSASAKSYVIRGWVVAVFPREAVGVLSLVCFWIAVAFTWTLLPQGLFAGTDGRLLQVLTDHAQTSGELWKTNNVNTLQGAFNLALPANHLLSTTFPLLIWDGWLALFLACMATLMAFTGSVYLLARAVGLGPGLASAAVLLSCLQTVYPFQHEFSTSVQFLIWPTAFFSIAQFNVLLALLAAPDGPRLVWRYAAFLGVLVWAIAAEPLWALVNGLFYAPFFAIFLLAKGRSLLRHGVFLVGILAIVATSGLLQYLYTLGVGNSRSMVMEAWRGAGLPEYASSVFSGEETLALQVFVLFAIAFGALFVKGGLRVVSLGLFLLLAGLYAGAIYYVAFAQTWRYLMPLYYESHVYQVFIVASLAVVKRLLDQAASGASGLQGGAVGRVGTAGLALLPALAALFYAVNIAPDRLDRYVESLDPYRAPAEVAAATLRHGRADETEAPFSVAVLNIGPKQTPAFDHVVGSLIRSDVRTMNEYAQTVTPPAQFLVTRLTESADAVASMPPPYRYYRVRFNKLTLAGFQENLFRAFGAKAVVSGAPLAHPALEARRRVDLSDGGVSYVYRLRDATFVLKPREALTVSSFPDVIDVMRRPDIDVRETLIIEDPSALGAFGRAESAAFRVGRNRLHVSVKAAGPTVVALPVYFSHCWEVAAPETAGARIFRANGAFTGLAVNGSADVTLRFTYGLLSAGCRVDDMDDWRDDITAMAAGPGLWNEEEFLIYAATPGERLREAVMKAQW
ncbi:MAG: hypothetical protein NXI21_06760 [Alphaproteobacteria bacterium]|nr:hypothetical protein [Alphaproteobacteria bacterium]